jgi:hypothetical protein
MDGVFYAASAPRARRGQRREGVIVDAFPFFNELDILELRLTELSPVVDRFVIVEANRTHKGTLKPLYYAENKARFAEWEDKIVHIVCALPDDGDGLPAIRRREMMQRNAILAGVRDCADTDMIMISDCDEIPRAHLVPSSVEDGVIVCYVQKLYYYNLNTHAPDRPWPGTRACRVSDARALSPHVVRNGMGQPDAHYPRHVHLGNAGWHFLLRRRGADSIQDDRVLTSGACHGREHDRRRHRRAGRFRRRHLGAGTRAVVHYRPG